MLCHPCTPVGAGSLVIALLLVAYPRLRPAQLVGTGIVAAIPLVAAATVGHLLFGDVQLAITASLLVGARPGSTSARGCPPRVRRPSSRRCSPRSCAVLRDSALALLKVDPPLVVAGALASLVTMALLRPPRRTEARHLDPVG